MLSQFVSSHEGTLLGALDFPFPEGIHAVGRLDKASEGLLILTTNKKITKLLFQGKVPHQRTYLVKVRNTVTEEKRQQLQNGIQIRVTGGEYIHTAACTAILTEKPEGLFERAFPEPEYPPYTWLTISLTEGRFHQIRKMVKAINHRCERLIRISIENLLLGALPPGGVKEIEEALFFELLNL